ncbi:cytochrome c(L), periplasmic [Methylophilus aquaticus]|uniref:Cytochrome c(L), periplasmic n=2 Tax=Methylophilus aquaticus TaxID=1971610 RepID=A0ABT9JUI2_9PROT|nr:cytochrome c(L), periplasmic [Methylophilus aquaticus]MDP8568222.1 cytochrome c(L), periplasmic [Methylophilus aquaticus]
MKVSQQPQPRRIGQQLAMTFGVTGLVMAAFFTVACAKADGPAQEKAGNAAPAKLELKDGPPLEFRGTLSGDVLEMVPMEDEVVTPEAKHFLATGENPYQGNQEAVNKGYTIFSTACSGCHGHLAEGKLGPALADDYWTYPKNETDKGIFETIYGGAAGMMGPQQGRLTVDEILHVIAWVRHQAEENAKNGGAAANHG